MLYFQAIQSEFSLPYKQGPTEPFWELVGKPTCGYIHGEMCF